jgi:hypothetical protein
MTKLKNQREMAQTADLGGEKMGGLAQMEGMHAPDMLPSARTW